MLLKKKINENKYEYQNKDNINFSIEVNHQEKNNEELMGYPYSLCHFSTLSDNMHGKFYLYNYKDNNYEIINITYFFFKGVKQATNDTIYLLNK